MKRGLLRDLSIVLMSTGVGFLFVAASIRTPTIPFVAVGIAGGLIFTGWSILVTLEKS